MAAKYTEWQIVSVVNRLYAGDSAKEISQHDGIPLDTVKEWKRLYDTPQSAKRRYDQRKAFIQVLDTFNKIRSSLGTTPSMDYAQNTGGSGAQYAISDFTHQLIDYQVDVDKAVRETLTESETEFYEENLVDKDFDMTNQSSTFMRMQEHLGKEFTARGLYPVAAYFSITKETNVQKT